MVDFTIEVVADSSELAQRAAAFVAERARAAVADHGHFSFAVSGGHTPWAMFAELAHEDVPWSAVTIYQVDERVAPAGDPDRNLTHLHESLTSDVEVVAMPVNEVDLQAAARAYSTKLPAHFDLVHLGLGPDGHTASLVPGDPVLDVNDVNVGVTEPYMGHQRMTLTYPCLDHATEIMWLISGADKHDPLQLLYAGDTSIPAGRINADQQFVFVDRAAAGQ